MVAFSEQTLSAGVPALQQKIMLSRDWRLAQLSRSNGGAQWQHGARALQALRQEVVYYCVASSLGTFSLDVVLIYVVMEAHTFNYWRLVEKPTPTT